MGNGKNRVFFALWPDAETVDKLQQVARDWMPHVGGRPLRRHDLHMTLAFVGDVDESRIGALREMASAIESPSFTLKLDRCGCWVHSEVAWVGCLHTPPELVELASTLGEGLVNTGYPTERRRFKPHITLLRRARCDARLAVGHSIKWKVDKFMLAQSHLAQTGATYDILGHWNLA